MAFPTAVNGQITDVVAEPNAKTKENEGAETVKDQAAEGEPEEHDKSS